MSCDDLKNYLVYYNVGKDDESVDDKVNRIFDKFCTDKDKNRLVKNELFEFSARNGVASEDVSYDVHYPDRFYDDSTSIPIKKVSNNRYYSDFCLSRASPQMGVMSTNTEMRMRGKYIDGTPFEFVQLTKKEKNKREMVREKVKVWWEMEKPKRIRGNKALTIKSQVFDGIIEPELRPTVKFSILTIKNGVKSKNVNKISLDCDIVRVFVTIVTSESNGRTIK